MSESLKWFRLYTEIINDDKVRLLAFEDRWHYIAVLCLKAGGVLDEQDAELRWQRIRVNLGLADADLEKMLDRLAKVRLIDRKTLEPLAWNRRQFVSDHDPTAADRLKRFRDKKKGETDMKRVSSALRNGHETRSETETEKEEEKTLRAVRAVVVKPDGVSDQTWSDFLAVRKAKRAPITLTALAGIEREALKAGLALESALRTCAERGWQSLKADWVTQPSSAQRNGDGTKRVAI